FTPENKLPCAGIVVLDRVLSNVILVKTPAGVWGFPKGKRNSGETLPECAIREFREETGLDGPSICEPIREDLYVDEPSSSGKSMAIRLYATVLLPPDPIDQKGKREFLPAVAPQDLEELAEAGWVSVPKAFEIL